MNRVALHLKQIKDLARETALQVIDFLRSVFLWILSWSEWAIERVIAGFVYLGWSAPKAGALALLSLPSLPYRLARAAIVIFLGLGLLWGSFAYAKHKVIKWVMADYIAKREAMVSKLKEEHEEKLKYLQRELDRLRTENSRLEKAEAASDIAANQRMSEIARQGSSCVLDDAGRERVNAIVAEANR